MMLLRRHFPVMLVLSASSIYYACTFSESSFNENQPAQTTDVMTGKMRSRPEDIFTKTVGAPVSGFTGRKWISNYNRAHGTTTISYQIEMSALTSLVEMSGCVGISFYYGRDFQNNLHILPIATNAKGRKIPTSAVPTESGSIDWATANSWIQRNTSPTKAHFMGANLIQKINCVSLKATLSIDDHNLQQLLFSDAAEEPPVVYYDRTATCPPFCESEF